MERRRINTQGDENMTATQYTVRSKKRVKSIGEGRDWSENALPDAMFVKKYNFDGHEFGPVGEENQSYELFWYPKTLESAVELLTLLDQAKQEASLEVLQ